MFSKLRKTISTTAYQAIEIAGAVLAGSGATLAIFLGKLFAAAILAAITLGIFLRITGRRSPPTRVPTGSNHWLQAGCAILTLIEVTALAEATKLPVIATQPGFEKLNWLIVLVALLVLYFLQFRFFRGLFGKAGTRPDMGGGG